MNPVALKVEKQAPCRSGTWRMFDRIAGRYDFLNRLLSLRRDVAWRKRVARHLPDGEGLYLLDLATGTADQLISVVSRCRRVTRAVGLDLSENMLEQGRRKLARRALAAEVQLASGDAGAIPFPDNTFDAVTMSFGIRNVERVDQCLQEMRRVLKPGGRALVLEFGLPTSWWFRPVYLFYFRHILPVLGGWISGDGEAYRYLNRSVEEFPNGDAFCALMRQNGFARAGYHPLSLGIAALYVGDKDAGRNPPAGEAAR
jgi:demethylmenaquinone methyltransferase/2-methoxy-6-polyprenyl-1,4-benzoquinol methylase